MEGERRELCMSLCAQAAVEQDPVRLIELMKQINDLFEEKRLHEKQMYIAESEKLISWWPV